jgi:hypothetical protein
MGLVGSLLGYLALEAGEKAESIVGMETCVGELIEKHSENGETAFIFFLGSYVLVAAFLLIRKYVVKKGLPAVVNIVPLAGMILGGVYLVKAGHQGYELVYKHGVSVHKDAATCKGGGGTR